MTPGRSAPHAGGLAAGHAPARHDGDISERDDDVEIAIDHVVIDLEGGGGGDEALAGEVSASILATLARLSLEA